MLTDQQIENARKTMSSNAFFALVMNALETGEDLSIVRAADGEKILYQHCLKNPAGILEPNIVKGMDAMWLARYGCTGIPRELLRDRIEEAATTCHYFAPSVSGLRMPAYDLYDLFPAREIYVDNFFPNLWDDAQKGELFKKARRVLMLHASETLTTLVKTRARIHLGVDVTWRSLTNWRETDDLIAWSQDQHFPLTIFSAGPAGKYIGPRLPGVTLDIGEAAKRWTFEKYA